MRVLLRLGWFLFGFDQKRGPFCATGCTVMMVALREEKISFAINFNFSERNHFLTFRKSLAVEANPSEQKFSVS